MKNILKLVFFLIVAFSVNNSFSQESKSDAIRVIEAKLISAQEMSNNNVISVLDGKREVYLISQLGDIKELCDKHNIPLPERYSYLYFRYHIMKLEADNSCEKKFSEHYELAYYYGKDYLDKTSNSTKAATLERRSEINYYYIELKEKANTIENKKKSILENFESNIRILDSIKDYKILSTFIENNFPKCDDHYSIIHVQKKISPVKYETVITLKDIINKQNYLYKIYLDNEEDENFKLTKAKNTIYEYQNYINNYPKGKYVKMAKDSITSLIDTKDYEEAISINQISYYESYIEKHPNGKFILNAKKAIETLHLSYDSILFDRYKFWDVIEIYNINNSTGFAQRHGRYIANSNHYSNIPTLNSKIINPFFESHQIEGYKFIKGPSPIIKSDYSAGAIDFKYKDFYDTNYTQIDFISSFRSNTAFKSFLQPESNFFHKLGFLNKNNNLPNDFSQLHLSEAAQDDINILSESAKSLNNNFVPKNSNANFDRDIHISHFFSKKIKKLLINNSTSYQFRNNKIIYNKDGIQNASYYDNYSERIIQLGTDHSQYLSSSFFNRLAIKLNNNNQLYSNFRLNTSNNSQYIERTYSEQLNTNISSSETTSHIFNIINNIQTSLDVGGEHILNNNRLKINWNIQKSEQKWQQPDSRRFTTYKYTFTSSGVDNNGVELYQLPQSFNPLSSASIPYVGVFGRDFNNMTEKLFTQNIQITQKLFKNMDNDSWVFKSGLFIETMKLDYHSRTFGYFRRAIAPNFNQPIPVSDYAINELLSDENFGVNNAGQIFVLESTKLNDSYNGANKLFGGFGLIEGSINNKASIATGFRFENNKQFLWGNNSAGDTLVIENFEKNVLPYFKLDFHSLNRSKTLSFEYAESVNRPSIREISPTRYYDIALFYISIEGNDSLLTSTVKNFNATLKFQKVLHRYFEINLFHRIIKTPIELYDNITSFGGAFFKYFNSPDASIQGINMHYQKSLKSLEKKLKLKDFGVMLNSTIQKSVIKNLYNNECLCEVERPLSNVPNHLIYAGLFFESKSNFGGSIYFKSIGKSIYAPRFTEWSTTNTDLSIAARNQLNIILHKKFKNNLLFSLQFEDITNQTIRLYYKNYYGEEFTFEQFKPGVYTRLGVSYVF